VPWITLLSKDISVSLYISRAEHKAVCRTANRYRHAEYASVLTWYWSRQ